MVKKPSEPRQLARERILEVAMELFYRDGIRAVGVDTIVAQSGVAKMSLYRSFPSKDDLVVAFLEARKQRFWQWWDGILDANLGTPHAQILALFQAVIERTAQAEYRGCPFINTATEFPDPNHPARTVALTHQRELRDRLLQLSIHLSAANPEVLADQLLLLLNGAFSTAGTLGGTALQLPTALLKAVETLLDNAVTTE